MRPEVCGSWMPVISGVSANLVTGSWMFSRMLSVREERASSHARSAALPLGVRSVHGGPTASLHSSGDAPHALLDMLSGTGDGADKRMYKYAKQRLGTHKRAVAKREAIKDVHARMKARQAMGN